MELETSLHDVTHLLGNAGSKVIRKALDDGGVVKALSVRGLAGIFAYEPFEGIRLGKELSELVRFYGLGGIFHSDELPAYGITDEDVNTLRGYMRLEPRDAFILFAGPGEKVSNAVYAVMERLKQAFIGVASETRAATPEGKTIYLRPRPGSARMYPETDIPPIPISKDALAKLGGSVPKPWDEYVDELCEHYSINRVLAEKVFDSEYFELFEELASNIKSVQPSFIASTLSEGIISLEREGLDASRLKVEHIKDAFYKVDKGEVAKESILAMLALLMRGKASSVEEAMSILGIKAISEDELASIINSIIDENMHIVKSKGINAINPLMGLAMSRLRGRVDGSKVNVMIRERLKSLMERGIE
jgi:glutamyl-tRNA(Gln) amidotransferase subunit E